MKYFLDTEFISHQTGIELVSLALVREDGQCFYAENMAFNPQLADKWVIENVLNNLLYWKNPSSGMFGGQGYTQMKLNEHHVFSHQEDIRICVDYFLEGDDHPKFYAYFASYDWVVFRSLFGKMVDTPEKFPFWIIDLKQMMWERGLTEDWKNTNCPDPEGIHNALEDAKWNRKLYSKIINQPLI